MGGGGRAQNSVVALLPSAGHVHPDEDHAPLARRRDDGLDVVGSDGAVRPWRKCDQVGPARRGARSIPAAGRMVHTVEAPIW